MSETTPDKTPEETPEEIPEVKRDLIPMRDASTKIGVSLAKLSRLAKIGKIYSEENPFDNRVRMVDLNQLKIMFPQEKKLSPRKRSTDK